MAIWTLRRMRIGGFECVSAICVCVCEEVGRGDVEDMEGVEAREG